MSYPGGKNGAGVWQKIICQIPPHDIYIEPFGGSGAVLRRKRPARLNIFVDHSLDVVECFNYRIPGELKKVHGDGIEFLASYDWQGREFIYCDPPYLIETRRSKAPIYDYEFREAQHEQLLKILVKLPAKVMISGYASTLYADYLNDWQGLTFQAMTRGGPATEYLWMNYYPPVKLHDYRFLGANRTERQRIKRKAASFIRKLERLPILERQAILAAIQSLDE